LKAGTSGYSGYNVWDTKHFVTAVTAFENALVTEKPNVSNAVTDVTDVTAKNDRGGKTGEFFAANGPAVTTVTARNDKGGEATGFSARPGPPTQPTEPERLYSIRELDRWYEGQRDHRSGLDQDPLVRDLLQRLAEPGLSPYTIRDLAHWCEAEAGRRGPSTMIDQDAIERDLRHLIAERGVFPEFIALEFDRVMQIVFSQPKERRP
jgi:hypothetical protein